MKFTKNLSTSSSSSAKINTSKQQENRGWRSNGRPVSCRVRVQGHRAKVALSSCISLSASEENRYASWVRKGSGPENGRGGRRDGRRQRCGSGVAVGRVCRLVHKKMEQRRALSHLLLHPLIFNGPPSPRMGRSVSVSVAVGGLVRIWPKSVPFNRIDQGKCSMYLQIPS